MGTNELKVLETFLSPLIDMIAEKVSERILIATAKKEPKFYSRRETAQLLRITLPTLSRLTRDGILVSKRMGGRILYDAKDINEAVKEQVIFKYRRK
jgi:DNA-binding transcriptional regulator YhcF (GntR family)